MNILEAIKKVQDWIINNNILDSEDISAERCGNGMRLHLNNPVLGGDGGGDSTQSSSICKIVSGTTASGYIVEIYGNGKDKDKTGDGYLFILDIALYDNLLSGTYVLASPATITITGGS